MRREIVVSIAHGLILFIAELVRNHGIRVILLDNPMVLRKINEITTGGIRINLEPFCAFLARDTEFLQISMEVPVHERPIRFRHIGSLEMPPGLVLHPGGMRLLSDACFHIAFCKTNLGPAILIRIARKCVCIALWSDLCGCINLYSWHY